MPILLQSPLPWTKLVGGSDSQHHLQVEKTKPREKTGELCWQSRVEVRGKEAIEALTSERLPLFGYLCLHGWDGHHWLHRLTYTHSSITRHHCHCDSSYYNLPSHYNGGDRSLLFQRFMWCRFSPIPSLSLWVSSCKIIQEIGVQSQIWTL